MCGMYTSSFLNLPFFQTLCFVSLRFLGVGNKVGKSLNRFRDLAFSFSPNMLRIVQKKDVVALAFYISTPYLMFF